MIYSRCGTDIQLWQETGYMRFMLKNVYTSLFFLEPNVCIYEMLKDVLYMQEMLTHFDTFSL